MTELTDIAILLRALQLETNPKNGDRIRQLGWSSLRIGASTADVKRLVEEHLVELRNETSSFRSYRLTEKGRGVVAMAASQEKPRVLASELMEAFGDIVGFGDLKQMMAEGIESGNRNHFLLQGPPATAKSLFIEAIRQVAPHALLVFGSRTSAAGLSNVLFEEQPSILLMDEADKMDWRCYSVLLGLMESAEVIETKSGRTRGIKLETTVIAACNSSKKMTPEFLSRFAMHAHFKEYTREQFIEVCIGYLVKKYDADSQLAALIGETVFEQRLGDVRKARDILKLMRDPTREEMERVVRVMIHYGDDHSGNKRAGVQNGRLEGM